MLFLCWKIRPELEPLSAVSFPQRPGADSRGSEPFWLTATASCYLRPRGPRHCRPSGSESSGFPSSSRPQDTRCRLICRLPEAKISSTRNSVASNNPINGAATRTVSQPDFKIVSCTMTSTSPTRMRGFSYRLCGYRPKNERRLRIQSNEGKGSGVRWLWSGTDASLESERWPRPGPRRLRIRSAWEGAGFFDP